MEQALLLKIITFLPIKPACLEASFSVYQELLSIIGIILFKEVNSFFKLFFFFMMMMMTMTIIATCILSISTVGLYNVNHIVNFIVYVSDLKQLY